MERLINFLKKLIYSPVKVYLILMGGLTALGSLLVVVFPAKFASKLIVLPLIAIEVPTVATPLTSTGAEGAEVLSYKPIVQHWAILLTLVGLFMVIAAFKKEWEWPAMAISGIEKTFIALFGWCLYPTAFVTLPGLLLDTAGTIYSLLYFGLLLIAPAQKGAPSPEA